MNIRITTPDDDYVSCEFAYGKFTVEAYNSDGQAAIVVFDKEQFGLLLKGLNALMKEVSE